MKRIINKWLLLLITALVVITSSCKKEDSLNLNVSSVSQLYFPETNKYIKLQPATPAAVTFEWSEAKAEDGSLVMYEVAFDKADGNFSKPIYTVASDRNGVNNTLTLSHKVLNKIANMAGIAPLAAGTLKWTVLSSKGTNLKKADSSRTLVVERPNGLDVPDNVYITGDATESGDDLSNALSLKLTNGVFEIFTKLKPGTFYFTDRNSGTPNTYSINGTTLKEGGTNTQTTEGIYLLRLDFTNAAAEMLQITDVGLYASAYDAIKGTLTYNSKGVWSMQNVPVVFFDFGSWKDDRFKFRFATKDAGGTAGTMFYGSVNASNSTPPDASTPASYYNVVPVNNSQWDYTYKYPSAANGKNIDVTLDMGTSKADYSYTLTVK